MNLRKWSYLFFTTLGLGTASSVIVGFFLMMTDSQFQIPGISGVVFNLVVMALAGAMFGVLSHMGFFAYLTVNYIGKGIFRSIYAWNMLQVFLLMLTLFYLVYLRYVFYGEESNGFVDYLPLPAVLTIYALAVAYVKVKMTNPNAFVPTLFYLTVATTLELIPAFRTDNTGLIMMMSTALFVCNAWQILKLHTLLESKND